MEITSLEDFERRFGAGAVDEVLETIVEEMWSRDSQRGICLSAVETLDTLGGDHRVQGSIEYARHWFEFELFTGVSSGTSVEYFELSESPSQEPIDLLCNQVEDFVVSLTQNEPLRERAAAMSLAVLKSKHPRKRLSQQSRQFHNLVGGCLADLALQRQDFALEAVEDAAPYLTSRAGLQRLYLWLTPALKERLATKATQLGQPDNGLSLFVEVLSRNLERTFFEND